MVNTLPCGGEFIYSTKVLARTSSVALIDEVVVPLTNLIFTELPLESHHSSFRQRENEIFIADKTDS